MSDIFNFVLTVFVKHLRLPTIAFFRLLSLPPLLVALNRFAILVAVPIQLDLAALKKSRRPQLKDRQLIIRLC